MYVYYTQVNAELPLLDETMGLLEYENQIFLEGFQNDGLFITAR